MRPVVRYGAVAALSLTVVFLMAVSTTLTSVALAATALIMGGTGHPLSVPKDDQTYITDFVNNANDTYIAPSGLCGKSTCTLLAVYTPEQFRFDTGLTDMTLDESVEAGSVDLNNCIRGNTCTVTADPYDTTGDQTLSDKRYVVYGYSQSSVVATVEKRTLIADPPPTGTHVGLVLLANPNKPNGGVLERFEGLYIPILGVTFNGATPTDTDMITVDVSRQYDAVSDLPTNPLNLLSDVNALLGSLFLHGDYWGVGTPQLQGRYGDTTYYLIPTPVLPLLIPLTKVPVIGTPLAVTLDPVFRVLVEASYNRTINPGQPTKAQWLYFPKLVSTAVNLVRAVPTGLDNGISYVAADPSLRPFGTTAPGPYGVGGPPVDAGCVGSHCHDDPTPALNDSSPTTTVPPSPAKRAPALSPRERKPTKVDEPTTDTDTPAPTVDTSPTKPRKPTGILSAFSTDVTTKPPHPRKPFGPRPGPLPSLANRFHKHSATNPPAAGDETPTNDTSPQTAVSTGVNTK
jgi:PE-PPE domain